MLPPSGKLPAWQAAALSGVLSQDVVLLQFATAPRSTPLSLLHRAFNFIEKLWFRHEHDSLRPVDPPQHVPVVKIDCNDYLCSEEGLRQLGALDLQLVYAPDYDGAPQNWSTVLPFGIWYHQFGLGEDVAVPAFREVMEEQAVTGSMLLMKKDNGILKLYEGSTPSIPYSVRNNLHALLWKTASYLGYRIESLRVLGDDFMAAFPRLDTVSERGNVPGNIEMIQLATKNLSGYLAYKKQIKKQDDRFTIYFSFNSLSLPLLPGNFNAFSLPAGAFFADPFVVKKNDHFFLFFECYEASAGKAHIAMMESDGSTWTAPVTVLEKAYHLSYPFVFEWEGSMYMLPETSSNGTVELYKATVFPYQWELAAVLMKDIALIDATLHFHDGLWWLFGNSTTHPFVSTNDQLHLFYSKDLFSENWIPHPLNPVATHAGNCRPAGRIFKKDGKLYRPAQNNASQQYGYGLVINEIEVMNENQYRERIIQSIDPADFSLKAMHHLDAVSGLTVIDGIPARG